MTALLSRGSPTPLVGTDRWLQIAPVWQALLALGALGALGAAITGVLGELPALALVLLAAALLGAAVASGVSVPLLRRRAHLGRTLALAVNYLLFLCCAALVLHRTGMFTGIDALGDTFPRGLPFLGLALLGYLVAYLGDRWSHDAARTRVIRRVTQAIWAVSAIGFLLAVGLLPGLATLAGRIVEPISLSLTVLAVLAATVARQLWRVEAARAFEASSSNTERLNGFLLLSPNLIGFVLFFAGPLLFSLFVSFTSWDAFGPKTWIGLDNYQRLLSLDVARASGEGLKEGYAELFRIGNTIVGARDRLFWTALRNIVVFAAMAIPLSVAPALMLATQLNRRIPGMKVFRAVFFIPSVAGVVGVTLIWKQIYDATVGFLNYGLTRLAELFAWLPFVDGGPVGVRWLSDSSVALLAIVIVFAYQYIGFNTVLFLAGLQSVPADLYEAAQIDGANAWQRFRNITIPMLKPTTFFVVATTGVFALQLFSEPFIMFSNFSPPGSGPGNAGLTPVVYLYQMGFQRFAQGYASAVAWVLFLFIFAFTFVQFRRQRADTGAFEG
jgi:ABC-type sugar transport system permease subunit